MLAGRETLMRMSAVVQSILMAVGQLTDPAILRVLAKSLAITAAIFVAFAYALNLFLPDLLGAYLDVSGDVYLVISVLIFLLAAWLLFRIVALAVLQFFADEIVLAVERRHYPEAAQTARKLPFKEDLANSLKGLGRALLFNALALPVALVLAFTAIGPAIVFLLVNAVLLGRELCDMPWLRQKQEGEGRSPVGPANRLLLGASIAGLMLVPFANLLAPVIGAAAGTHLFQKTRGKQPI